MGNIQSKLACQIIFCLVFLLTSQVFKVNAQSSPLQGVKIGYCTISTDPITDSITDKKVLKYWMKKELEEYGIMDTTSKLFLNICFAGFISDGISLNWFYFASVGDGSMDMPRTYYYFNLSNGVVGKIHWENIAERTIRSATKDFIKEWVGANTH
jgi:hypothetical protein